MQYPLAKGTIVRLRDGEGEPIEVIFGPDMYGKYAGWRWPEEWEASNLGLLCLFEAGDVYDEDFDIAYACRGNLEDYRNNLASWIDPDNPRNWRD